MKCGWFPAGVVCDNEAVAKFRQVMICESCLELAKDMNRFSEGLR